VCPFFQWYEVMADLAVPSLEKPTFLGRRSFPPVIPWSIFPPPSATPLNTAGVGGRGEDLLLRKGTGFPLLPPLSNLLRVDQCVTARLSQISCTLWCTPWTMVSFSPCRNVVPLSARACGRGGLVAKTSSSVFTFFFFTFLFRRRRCPVLFA